MARSYIFYNNSHKLFGTILDEMINDTLQRMLHYNLFAEENPVFVYMPIDLLHQQDEEGGVMQEGKQLEA